MSTQTLRSVSDLRWTYRLLLVQTSDPRDFLGQCQKKAPELADRKLLVVVFSQDDSDPPKFQLNQDLEMTSHLAQLLHQKIADHHAVLIGLDGGSKAHFSRKNFSFEAVFSEIDAMPMRRQELRQRESN